MQLGALLLFHVKEKTFWLAAFDLLCTDAHRAPQALALDSFVHHGWFGEI